MLKHKPAIDVEWVRQLLVERYEMEDDVVCRPLPGERDQNFLIESTQGKFVLKVFNLQEEQLLVEAQSDLLSRLDGVGICPTIRLTRQGDAFSEWEIDGATYWVRVVTYLEGQLLKSVRYKSPQLLQELGRRVAQIDIALEGFDHPAFHYEFDWCLEQGASVVNRYQSLCQDETLRQQIDVLMSRYHRHTVQHLEGLPKSVIHNDANDGNVVVARSEVSCLLEEVTGIIDIGDAIYSWTVGDLAIAIAYAILESPRPLADAVEVIKGYHEARPLSCDEVDSLFGLVCLRLCASACMAAQQTKIRPDDEYLSISQQPIRATLPKLLEIPFQLASATFRAACGFAVIDSHDSVTDGCMAIRSSLNLFCGVRSTPIIWSWSIGALKIHCKTMCWN